MRMTRIVWCCVAIGLFCAPAMPRTKGLSAADRAFLRLAADADMTEAHVGQMAERQSSRDSVKDFGKTIAKDHTDSYQELTALARNTGAAIPKGIDVRKNGMIEQLTRLKGTRFDREFVQIEIRDQERAIAGFKREAAHGRDADLKAYAARMLPVLENRLHATEKLAGTEKRT